MFNYGTLQTSITPAPQTSIELSNPSNNSKSLQVDAIVDTGAVMTCVPESVIKQLGESLIYSTIQVRDANGNIQERRTYRINIRITDYEYKNVEVIPITKQYALIGRDILNQHKIILDAPNQKWSISDS